jgi:hypothetical protein
MEQRHIDNVGKIMRLLEQVEKEVTGE